MQCNASFFSQYMEIVSSMQDKLLMLENELFSLSEKNENLDIKVCLTVNNDLQFFLIKKSITEYSLKCLELIRNIVCKINTINIEENMDEGLFNKTKPG